MRTHTVCTQSGVSGIMRAASKDISRSTELSIIRESRPRARIFSNNYFQSTLLLFQLPASAHEIADSESVGDSGVSSVQRAIVREILQRSAVDVRPADLRGLLCDLVYRVQFAHIKHTRAHTNMMCTLRCTEVEHLAGSVWSSVERFSRARTLTWRPVGPRHMFFPTMKVLGMASCLYVGLFGYICLCIINVSERLDCACIK